MRKILFISAFSLLLTCLYPPGGYAKNGPGTICKSILCNTHVNFLRDTVTPAEVMDIITSVIYSANSFDMKAVANLYAPNAVIADDEAPFSWNGPTAGIQWLNAVEKACKDIGLTKFKATMELVNVFQQNADNIYMIVPVSYNGNLPLGRHFVSKGAFSFVLKWISGKWLIKSQAWIPSRGM